jgi:hypothetical protein
MKLNSDFSDLLSALNAADVRYLVVGAYAVAYYAEPRFTKDLDVWVEPSSENASRVWQALETFGAPLQELTMEDLCTSGTVFQIGVPPNRVDVLTEISGGISFEEAWSQRMAAEFGTEKMWMIGETDLIRNKRATARPQDIRDLKMLALAEKKRTGIKPK